jgi:hypothetical protein
MPMKAVGMAAPASETLLLSESEPEPELSELPVEEELPPVLVVVPALERLVLRLEVELLKVPLVPGMVPLLGMRVPVPMTVGAEVMDVALARLPALLVMEATAALRDGLLSALLTSEEAAAVSEETPARSVGTR